MEAKKDQFVFFKNMPFELRVQAYAYLTPEELFKTCRAIDKESKQEAIIALCSKLDKKSIRFQRILFVTHIEPLLLPIEFITGLQKALQKAMESPFSDTIHKLSALLFISKIKGIPSEISEEILSQSVNAIEDTQFLHDAFQALMAYQPLERIDELARLAATECTHADKVIQRKGAEILRLLSPLASSAQLSSLVNDSLSRITSGESSEHQLMSWDNMLPILASHLRDAHDIDKLMSVSTTMLYDSDYGIHWGARTVLMACAKYATQAQIDVLITSVITHLHADNEVVRARALSTLEYVLAPYVTTTQIDYFIEAVIRELNNPETQVRVRMLYTIAALAPKANETQLDIFTKTAISALTDKHSDVRNAVTNTLTKLAPYLTLQQLDLLITHLISTLRPAEYNTYQDVPGSLPSLKMLASYTTPKHVDLFIAAMVDELNIPIAAIDTFAALAPYSSLSQQTIFINLVESHLDDYTKHLHDQDLKRTLSVLAMFVPASRIDELMSNVVTRMAHLDNTTSRNLALLRLSVLATHATSEGVDALLMQVANKLNDPAWDVRNVLDTLSSFLRHTTSAPPDTLIAALRNTLANADNEEEMLHAATLRTLSECAVRATPAQIDELIISLEPQLNAPDTYIRYLAVISLKALVDHATPAQIETLVNLSVEKLDDPDNDPNYGEAVITAEILEILCKLAAQATPVQMEYILRNIANKLNDIRPHFREATINSLSILMTNNMSAREHLADYNQTHQGSTMEHHLLNLMLNLYTRVYEPIAINAPTSNTMK